MGNCFSLRRLRFRIQQKSYQSSTSRKSPISATSTRRDASSNAAEEYEVEAASGFFSFGSDTSKAYNHNAADFDHAGGTDSQNFGILMAQETRAELRKSPTQRNSSGRSRSPRSKPQGKAASRKASEDRGQMRSSSPGGPTSVERAADLGQMRSSPGDPRLGERAGHDLMRKSFEESPVGRWNVEKTDHTFMCNSPGGPKNLEGADHGLIRNSPRDLGGDLRAVEKADPGYMRKNSSGIPRPVENANPGQIRKSFSGIPRPAESADRAHMRKFTSGSPRPVERANLGHVRNSSPGGPRPIEKAGLEAVVDSLNQKGRREFERLRGFSPDCTGSLENVRASNASSNRNGTGKKGNGRHSGPLYARQHAPVDFDFLAEKFTKDSSRRGKQTSPAPEDLAKDVELSTQSNENDHSGTSSSKSSLTMQEIDEFAKTYKESAAKAAARDRDMFKSMSTGESMDLSLTSSMAFSSPAIRPDTRPELRPEIWPEMPRRDSHTRSASTLSIPESEPEIVPVAMTFGTLINLDSLSKSKPASPSIPRSAVTGTRTPPPSSRPGIRAAGVRVASPAARGGSPAARGGLRRAQSFHSRNI